MAADGPVKMMTATFRAPIIPLDNKRLPSSVIIIIIHMRIIPISRVRGEFEREDKKEKKV